MRLALCAAIVSLALAPAVASARPGDPDRSFGSGGRTAFALGAAGAQVGGLVLRPGGHALVTGTAVMPDGGAATTITELQPSGAPDPAFGNGGTAFADPVATTAVQPVGVALAPGGSAIVATTVTSAVTGKQEVHLARVLGDGTTDPAFGTGGVAVLDFFNGNVHGEDVAVDSLGRILVAASTERDGRRYMSAFRLTPDGKRDRVFAGGRVDLDSRAFAGAILPAPDGGAYVSGGLLRSYGNIVTVHVSNRGQREDGFAGGRAHVRLTDHTRPGTGARDMVYGPGRSLIIAADVRPAGAREHLAVVRVLPNGRLDRRFANGGIFSAGTRARPFAVARLARDSRGRLLLAGAARQPATGAESALVMRLTRSGHADRSFGRRGVVVRRMGGARDTRFVDSLARAIAVGAGRVWVAGVAYDDEVDPVTDSGRAWQAVMRLLG